jgi:hypothetical protein
MGVVYALQAFAHRVGSNKKIDVADKIVGH